MFNYVICFCNLNNRGKTPMGWALYLRGGTKRPFLWKNKKSFLLLQYWWLALVLSIGNDHWLCSVCTRINLWHWFLNYQAKSLSGASCPTSYSQIAIEITIGYPIQYGAMGFLPDTYNCGLPMRRECRERFPRHRLQRKLLVSDPGMHHGTCVTHVPWRMSGSVARGGGGKCSRHSRRMLNTQFYAPGKRPMGLKQGQFWPFMTCL